MNTDALEDAIVAAVLVASGLPAGKVIWSKQGRSRPARPFIELDSQELPDNQHEEQAMSMNPSPTQDTPAMLDLGTEFPDLFMPGATLTVILEANGLTGLGSNAVTFATVMDGGDGFGVPRITWDPNTLELVGHCDAGYTGNILEAALNTWLSGPGDGLFFYDGLGSGLPDPQTDPFGPVAFSGGLNGTDFFLIDNVTHPEITIQLRCFSTEPRGSNRASAILKATSKKLGGLILTEQLDAAGIAVITRGTIQDVSVELQNEFEGRAVMALTIRTADKLTETADRFDKVTVETTIDRNDGNPPVVTSTTFDT